MSFTSNPLVHRISCPCRRWEWREIGAALINERRCPRCKTSYLLVFKMTVLVDEPARPSFRFLKAIPHVDRDAEGIRRSLVRVRGLNEDEIDLIMHVLEQIAADRG